LTDSPSAYRRAAALAIVLTAAVVAGCTPPPPPQATSTRRLYAIDQTGAAKTCSVPPVTLTGGQETSATLSVANDGGWCAFTVAAPGSQPYSAGLLAAAPAHGDVYVHSVGDTTRIDYTPSAGFTGTDAFAVKFVPGSPVLRVAVTVTPGPASVVAAPAPAPAPAPTPTRPTRR